MLQELRGSTSTIARSSFAWIEPQDTVPTDLKARVQDITGNCAGFLNNFLNALNTLSKSGQVYSHDFGYLLDRIKTVSTASDEFFAKQGAPAMRLDCLWVTATIDKFTLDRTT